MGNFSKFFEEQYYVFFNLLWGSYGLMSYDLNILYNAVCHGVTNNKLNDVQYSKVQGM